MNKQELLERITDIEWDDFEAKEARTELPKNILIEKWTQSSFPLIPLFPVNPEGLDEVNKGIRVDEKEAALLLRGLLQNKGSMQKKNEYIFAPIAHFVQPSAGGWIVLGVAWKHVSTNLFNISVNAIKKHIKNLKQKGVLERVGNNRTGYWKIKTK